MIFSNNEDIIDSVSILAPLGKSDHSIIESTLICTVTKQTNYYLDYKNADFKSMSSMFDNIFNADIEKITNVVDQYDIFLQKLQKVTEKYVPVKKKYMQKCWNQQQESLEICKQNKEI